MNKYKAQYEELVKILKIKLNQVHEYDEMTLENSKLQDPTDDHNSKDSVNDTYIKMIHLLQGMNLEYEEILPELGTQ